MQTVSPILSILLAGLSLPPLLWAGAPVPVSPAEIVAANVYLPDVTRDAGLYRSPDSVTGHTVVDTREPAAWRAGHIPGALSIEPRRIRVERRLRSRPVLLVDDGWGSLVLEDTCRALRAQGWSSVHILEGGMARWLREQRTVEGDGSTGPRPTTLTAAEYLSVRHVNGWLVLYTGTADERQPALMPEAVRVLPDPSTLSDDPRRILVVSRDGKSAGQVQPAVPVSWPVFVLEDGLDGLEQQLALMAGMKREGTRQTSDSPEGCATCP